MKNNNLHHYHHKESGVVLITSLIFLMVLTMIVISALRSGTLEERMSTNSRNRQVALQASEAVLRSAEDQLFSGTEFKSKFDSGAGTDLALGFYKAPTPGEIPRWQSIDWSSSSQTLSFSSGFSLEGLDSPKFIVEIISPPSRPNSTVPCSKGLASITSRGLGKDSSIVFTQAMYRYQSDRASDGC